MQQEVFASLINVPRFLLYFIVAAALVWLFKIIYSKVTPFEEIPLIREGNIAAAVSLSGALLGFTIALASVIMHSFNIIDLIIWGGVALIVQVLVYFVVRLLISDLSDQIHKGNIAHGTILAALSLCAGILNGACMTP